MKVINTARPLRSLTKPTAGLAAPLLVPSYIRWFLVTNGFKTTLVAIDLRGTIYNDPVSQGVASLVFVFIMLAATLRVMPYGKPDSNFLEAKLFGVVRWGEDRVGVRVGVGVGVRVSCPLVQAWG